MKKQMLSLALLLLTSVGAAQAQNCCKQECKADCCKGSGEKECCQKAAIENIMTRTSIRKFQQKAVEAEKVEIMLRAAMAAPTAVNKQPWQFVVVTDKQVLSELAGQGGRGNMLRNAPLAIVVCGDMNKALEGKGQQYWIQDTSAATENLLLAAHALGLGAVWTGAYPMEDRYSHIQKVLGMPESIVPLNICIIGYPDEQPTPKDKWKAENVSYNKFGNKK